MSYWADKRVVVTGGAGFLGSHVVEKLREAGCKHIFVVRSKDYDLTKEEAVARLFSDLEAGKHGWPSAVGGRPSAGDVVIHLAGLVGGIGANKARPADFFYQNIMIGVLTMHYAWKHGVGKFVAAGAGCGYPEHAPLPLREESFWDGFPQQESAPYSLAKRMLHIQSIAYWRQHRFPAIVTIPGNIYGPYDNFDLENAHVIPALVRKFVEAVDNGHAQVVVWGTGKPTRDFVYAGDVAECILRAAEVYNLPELVNLSSGRETSVREVVETLVEITGFDGEIVWDTSRPDGQARRVFDMSKAKRELGFEARTSLREGLQRTVKWYQVNRAQARNVVEPGPVVR
ncbi:MAG: GDP-L-fucose synthase [Chloroflexi bacterium]|nr:GDP-L-fucose synthase [Chloroflexota bacterium]